MATPLSKSMIIDGIAASAAIDSSGETVDIEGMDISDLEAGNAVLNYEHRGDKDEGASANDVVGHIVYAKKIYDKKDCANDREREYWDKVALPFIYIQGELFNDEGHKGAEAMAALIRYYQRRKMPILMRYSIEGSTLEREGNVLKQTLARRVALTLKPCNRTCVSGVLVDSDPGAEESSSTLEDLVRSEDPNRQLLGSYELEYQHVSDDPVEMLRDSFDNLREINNLAKALAAGSYGGTAPGNLTGGAALQVEDHDGKLHGPSMAAYRDWDKRSNFRKFLKSRVPDASDAFVDHFIKLIDDYEIKKARELEGELLKAIRGQVVEPTPEIAPPLAPPKATKNKAPKVPAPMPSSTPPPPEENDEDESFDFGSNVDTKVPLTVRGEALKPRPELRHVSFDEKTGILHTPRGSFPMYIPGRDPDPKMREAFQDILHSAKVNEFHDYAVDNWARLNKLLKEGRIPPEVVMHATLFSQLSPNTPTPVQELMYGHLVDAMNESGIDARDPNFSQIKDNWIGRDNPKVWPEQSRGHYEKIQGQLRLKNDASQGYWQGKKWVPKEGNPRHAGDIASFMLANNKFKTMAQYSTLHDDLVNTVNAHGDDARSASHELMGHKHKAGLWEAKRARNLKAGKPDIGGYEAGISVPGLAPKTTRYTMGMLGGGNVTVPDTHFVRYLFGLDKGHDTNSIKYLKGLLWNTTNAHILEGIDRYYGANHDAVQHMVEHPKFGHLFEGNRVVNGQAIMGPDSRPVSNRENAIFPAFWKNWVSIVPHERARGMTTGGNNEVTDHRPFWEAIDKYVRTLKSEGDGGSIVEGTAKLHRDWVDKHGQIPAMMLYYAHIVPQLLHEADRKDAVQKMEAAVAGLRSLRKGTEQKVEAPAAVPVPEPKRFEFNGAPINPGSIQITHGPVKGSTMQFMGSDSYHHYVMPQGGHALSKIPKEKEGKTFKILAHPMPISEDVVVDADKHGNHALNLYPEQRLLIHGLNLTNRVHVKEHTADGITSEENPLLTGWRGGPGGTGYVKPDIFEDQQPEQSWHHMKDMSGPLRDTSYYLAARQFFGLHQHVPVTAAFIHPLTGKKMSIISKVNGGKGFDYTPEHMAALKSLDNGTLDRLGIMDFVLGNNDRHRDNFMITRSSPRLQQIDNTNAYDYSKLHNPVPEYLYNTKDQPWHPQAAAWLQTAQPEDLADKLLSYGVPPYKAKEAAKRLLFMKQHVAQNPTMWKMFAHQMYEDQAAMGKIKAGPRVWSKPWTG